MRYFLIAVFFLFVGGLVTKQLYQPKSESHATLSVVKRSLTTSISLPGKITSLDFGDVTSSRPGKIISVNAAEGDLVKKGQLLAQLDSREATAWLQRNEAEVRLIQSQIRYLTNTLTRLKSSSLSGGESEQRVAESTADLEAAKAQLQMVQAEVARAKIALEDSNLLAPRTGQIIRLYTRVGEWVDPLNPLFHIADAASSVIEAKLEGADIDQIRIGQPVLVSTEGETAHEWREKVRWIAPASETTGLANIFRIRVSLESAIVDLRLGQQVDLEIITGERTNALVLPLDAIDYDAANHPRVALLTQNGLVWKEVKLGIESFTEVEIVRGIEEGQVVVLPQGRILRTGQKIAVSARNNE